MKKLSDGQQSTDSNDPPAVPTAENTATAVGSDPASGPRRVFWGSFLLLFFVTALWSVGNPLIAAVDEASHAIKAAASVRLDFSLDSGGQDEGVGLAEVPGLYDQLIDQQYCIAFQPDTTANCQPEFTGDLQTNTDAFTSAALYNPIYYVIAGLPSLLPAGEYAVYLMRLISALLSSFLAALALRTIAEISRSQWIVIGAIGALTPMVIYLSSAINPQSVENMGAFTLWVTLLALLRDPRPDLLTRRLARMTIATVFFVNARGFSPLYVFLIVVLVIAVSPWSNLVAVLKDRRSWPYLAVCVLASAFALIWIVTAGSLPSGLPALNPEYVGRKIIVITLGQTSEYIEGMFGVFGWLDTRMPSWVLFSIAGLLALSIFAGFALGSWRTKIVLAILSAMVILLPVAVHYLQARYLGIVWQGRYSLPLAMGLPLIAGFVMLEPSRLIPLWINRRLVLFALTGWATIQVVAFGINLHRYVNGFNGGWFQLDSASWLPPIHPYLLMVLAVLGWGGLAWVLFRSTGTGSLVVSSSTGYTANSGTSAELPPSDPTATPGTDATPTVDARPPAR